MRKYLWIVAVISAFALGIYITSIDWLPHFDKHTDQEASVLLERIEKVTKLVTVSGYFSEVYDYKDYYGYDWSIFRKKALIRVKANVLAGYDLDQINFEADSKDKVIIVSGLPKPEILSIDHDLDYYDLTEGTFNTFTKDDLNKLNEQAKDYVENAALSGDLIAQAEERGNELLETIRFLVEGSGWRLEMRESPPTLN